MLKESKNISFDKMIHHYQRKEQLFISPDNYHAFKINSNVNESSLEFKNLLKNIEVEKWIDLSDPVLSLLSFSLSMIQEGSKRKIYTFFSNEDLESFIKCFTSNEQKHVIMKARFAVLLNNFNSNILDSYCVEKYTEDYKNRNVFPIRILFENISSSNLEFIRVAFWFFAYVHAHTKNKDYIFIESLCLHLSLSELVETIEIMIEDKTSDDCFIVGDLSKLEDLILKD